MSAHRGGVMHNRDAGGLGILPPMEGLEPLSCVSLLPFVCGDPILTPLHESKAVVRQSTNHDNGSTLALNGNDAVAFGANVIPELVGAVPLVAATKHTFGVVVWVPFLAVRANQGDRTHIARITVDQYVAG